MKTPVCACGCGRPLHTGQRYAGSGCWVRVYNARLTPEQRAQRLANSIAGRRAQSARDKALPVGVTFSATSRFL